MSFKICPQKALQPESNECDHCEQKMGNLTYQAHQDINFVLERLVVLNLALLHCFDSNLDAYTPRKKERVLIL